jgi:hypothetical protein
MSWTRPWLWLWPSRPQTRRQLGVEERVRNAEPVTDEEAAAALPAAASALSAAAAAVTQKDAKKVGEHVQDGAGPASAVKTPTA